MEQNQPVQSTPQQPETAPAAPKKKRRVGRVIAKILLVLALVAAIVFLTLFISARIAGFSSTTQMMQFILSHM